MEVAVSTRLSVSEGRKFGFTLGIAFGVLGLLLLWRERELAAAVVAAIAALLLLGGLLCPTQMGPIQRGWMAFAHAISRVTTPVFMGLVYFAVVTPIGLVMRLIRGSPLVHGQRQGSVWITRRAEPGEADDGMDRQF